MMKLPPYSVRESSRARRVRLRATRNGGIEVVIPVGFDRRRVPALVESQSAWMHRASERIARERELLPPEPDDGRPARIDLRAVSRSLAVEYRQTDSGSTRARDRGETLVVSGAIDDPSSCRAALRRWLRSVAKAEFSPWLADLASAHMLQYERLTVRLQKGRWGSASSAGTISLNAKALFMPGDLVEHLMLHELCHTVEPNHSDRFYRLLASLEPDSDLRRRELRAGWQHVPRWADEEGEPPVC